MCYVPTAWQVLRILASIHRDSFTSWFSSPNKIGATITPKRRRSGWRWFTWQQSQDKAVKREVSPAC